MDVMARAFEEAKKNPALRKRLRIKAAFSLILLLGFLGVVFITVGTIISSKNGSFLGMTQLEYLKLRARYGIIMMLLITIHLLMNRGLMKKELEMLFG